MLDVAIVGAGPAGSAAAKILADKGFNVAIFEKEKLPRHKHCGGAVALRNLSILEQLEVNIKKVALHEYKGLTLSYKDIMAKHDWGKTMVWGIYREDFDYLITNRAKEAGAKVFNKRVKGFKEENGNLKIITDSVSKKTNLLFGADGINSTTRRQLGIPYEDEKKAFCLEYEIKTTKEKIKNYDDMIHLDFSYFKKGYAWIFPKKRGSTINVGVGSYLNQIQKSNVSIKNIFFRFIKEKEISNKIEKFHGALLPFGGTVDSFGRGNVILLGDAAGLASPISGEGIPYALESGIIGAECATKFFEEHAPIIESYTKRINPIAKEINEYALTLQKRIFGSDAHRKLVVEMCANYDNIMEIIGDTLINNITYEEGVKKLSPLKLLPPLLSTWYKGSIWSPISPYSPAPTAKWVRM